MDNKQTIQELRKAVHQLSTLAEISIQLNTSLDLDAVLETIIEAARQLLECEGASILLYDPQRNDLYFAAVSGPEENKIKEIRVPLENSLAGKIFTSGQILVSHNPQQDPSYFSRVSQSLKYPTNNLLGVPMRFGPQTIGVLEAINKRSGHFTADDGGLLSILASQAAVAIQNARMVQALQKAYQEIQETDRIKSTFLALASHELRTPLGKIIGYSAFLEEEADESITEFARQISQAAAQMKSIIEDMTSLTMLRKQKTVATQPQQLQPLIKQVLEEVRPDIQAHKHNVSVQVAPEARYVSCSPDFFRRALKSVLDNAIRFTPDGGVIAIEANASSSETVRITVRDNGIGIASEHLEKIFREFFQVENHMTRQHGGLGVGLAIAQGLIEAQNGRIWAESPGPGQGTSIHIELPRPRV